MTPSFPRPSFVQRVCWLFAGAEMHLLRQCPADFNRQASIGFTIFMTCLFAALSGGYAAWRFTAEGSNDGSWVAAVVFGLVWGVMIFSIDRSMVVTLKKDPTLPKQRFQVIQQYGWALVLRGLLAALLATLISIPVEVKFFEKEINLQFFKDANKAVSEQRNLIINNSGVSTYENAEKQSFGLETAAQQRANSQDNAVPGWSALHQQANQKGSQAAAFEQMAAAADQKARNMKPGPYISVLNEESPPRFVRRRSRNFTAYNNAKSQAATARRNAQQARGEQMGFATQATQLTTNYRNKNQADADAAGKARQNAAGEKNRLTTTVIAKGVAQADSLAKSPSFLRQFVALGHAAKTDGDVGFPLWLIRTLFFIFEILPTLVKIMTPVGEYDWLLYTHEQDFATRLRTNLRILQDQEQQRQTAEAAIAADYQTSRQQVEKELNENVLRETADRQNKLALQKLDEWYQQQSATVPTSHSNGQHTPAAGAAHTI